MKRLLVSVGAGILVFSVSFLAVTAVCDFICRHSSYYQEAANETVVLED